MTGSLESPETTRASLDALRQGLREHGYVEGQKSCLRHVDGGRAGHQGRGERLRMSFVLPIFPMLKWLSRSSPYYFPFGVRVNSIWTSVAIPAAREL